MLKYCILILFLCQKILLANYVEYNNEVLISLKNNNDSYIKFLVQNFNKSNINYIANNKLLISIKLPLSYDLQTAIQILQNDSNTEWAYPVRYYIGEFRESAFLSNDPLISEQNYLNIIQATSIAEKSNKTIIALTDDGFDLKHKDLQKTFYTNPKEIPNNNIDDDNNGYIDDTFGWNFNENNNNVQSNYDWGNHGTHLSGIIAADTNNSIGVAGISQNIKVMPLKFYGEEAWNSKIIYETYKYAVDNGAKIISTSYNIDFLVDDPIYLKALEYAKNNDVIVLNSSGNNDTKDSPRNELKNILIVGGTINSSSNLMNSKAIFANYGIGVDISAPATDIYSSTRSSRYGALSGTSQATPMVAAALAEIWNQNPDWSLEKVLQQMLTNTDEIDNENSNYKYMMGSGRLNITKSLSQPTKKSKLYIFGHKDSKIILHIKGLILKKYTEIELWKDEELILQFPLKQLNFSYGTNYLELELNDRSIAQSINRATFK